MLCTHTHTHTDSPFPKELTKARHRISSPPHCTDRKLRHRARKWLVQGHTKSVAELGTGNPGLPSHSTVPTPQDRPPSKRSPDSRASCLKHCLILEFACLGACFTGHCHGQQGCPFTPPTFPSERDFHSQIVTSSTIRLLKDIFSPLSSQEKSSLSHSPG